MGDTPRIRRLAPVAALAASAALASSPIGCGSSEERSEPPFPAADVEAPREGPATARWDIVDLLRAADAIPVHPSDGGGRAWRVRDPDQPDYTTRDSRDRFRIVYEVGPLGVATGGSVQLQVSPFWDWTTPQVTDPEAPGFTEIHPSAPDIALRAETLDRQLLGLEVTGRPLVEGERIELVYGAGPALAATDRYAERGSRFWIAVDGDGDGRRAFLLDSPTVDVRPGPPALLELTLPSVARPGEPVRVVVAVLDAALDTGIPFAGEVRFVDPPAGLELPASVVFAPEDQGRRSVTAVAREPGVYRLEAESADGVSVRSNPLVVSAEAPRILWADLHGHSNLSDGTGVPEDYFVYARDVSALDVVALTDHDHWGVLPLVDHPALWEEIRAQTARFHEPGRFVTLLGFEWTSWIYGHRHVLYFGDDGPVVDSVDVASDEPGELWAALGERPALTIAHHPAGGPIATDWEIAPDPRFETVTEVISIHGSSEAPDSPDVIRDAVPGHFARDALDRGYRLGFVGSGDRHDGHPGAYRRDAAVGGLAAILSEERTREGVLAALRARRVYATNGARIVLRVALGAVPMGGVIPVGAGEERDESLFVHVIASGPLERIDLVRSGAVVDGLPLEGRLEATLHRDVEGLRPGEYVYVRVVQQDGGLAWSSPIFVGSE